MAKSAAKVTTLTIAITVDEKTGEVTKVGQVVDPNSVKEIKGKNIKGLVLKSLTQNPSVIITSHSSPGCITYIVNGKYYRI
jgi:hypothetical protein